MTSLLFVGILLTVPFAGSERWFDDSHDKELQEKENLRIELHEDVMPPGNWTRFKLDHHGPMRVVVQSLQVFMVAHKLFCGDTLQCALNRISDSLIGLLCGSGAGDADIYVSYTHKYVNYHLDNHNASACSCGLDVIDIPENGIFSKRPAYLGIYAHPGKPVTSYRLMVFLAPNGTQSFDVEPEYINHVFQDKGGILEGDMSLLFEILSCLLEILITIFI